MRTVQYKETLTCDRCKKETTQLHKICQEGWLYNHYSGNYPNDAVVDLCDSCNDKLKAFLKPENGE